MLRDLALSKASDLVFAGWPQRDLNPCYRLERAAS
jgi:hypothetical protein